ncbi:2-phosphosulfolactate phosphatase [Streptomyces olivaceoviridis]|uniref:2-phosphosulfolactate phosphatase n=1 Tax=Streptomyces olivaceoviridis TaxID=1921 RepID=UPI0036F99407
MEDLLGAGALIRDLHAQGSSPLSAEATTAKASYEATTDIPHAIAASASGRQLIAMGFAEDVAIATDEDASALAPVRDGDGAFTSG